MQFFANLNVGANDVRWRRTVDYNDHKARKENKKNSGEIGI
jgi:formyltetrahydrofolate synthetase